MTTKKEQARALYFQKDMTQAEIAQVLNVNAKTVYRWMKQDHWERIKKAALNGPAIATEKLYFVLNKICDDIINKEERAGIPTLDEVKTLVGIATTIKKVGNRPSLVDHCESIGGFMDFVVRKDLAKGQLIAKEMDEYLYKEAELSAAYYKHYELPYHANKLQPVEEDMGDEFEDGSSIPYTYPQKEIKLTEKGEQLEYTKKEWREKRLKERNASIFADLEKNKKSQSEEKPKEEKPKQEVLKQNQPEEKTIAIAEPLLSEEKKTEIRQHVKSLFPNGRWEPAGSGMIRDICTNVKRRLSPDEKYRILSRGYTQKQLDIALE